MIFIVLFDCYFVPKAEAGQLLLYIPIRSDEAPGSCGGVEPTTAVNAVMCAFDKRLVAGLKGLRQETGFDSIMAYRHRDACAVTASRRQLRLPMQKASTRTATGSSRAIDC
ncbi:protein of unknown function [Burkholderia multivorans]